MIASRGMYIRYIAYIPQNWKDIRIADMNKLGAIAEQESDLWAIKRK